MSFSILLIILVPIMFIIGTTYNALKEKKKLENGKLKEILEKRALIKEQALKHKVKSHRK